MHHYRVILIAPPTGDRKLPALRYICLYLYTGQKFPYFWVDHWNNSHFSCAAAQCACDNIYKRTRSLYSFDPSTIRMFSDALKITWSTLISDHMVGLETSLQPTSESLPYLCTCEFLRVNLACPLTSLDWKRKTSQMANIEALTGAVHVLLKEAAARSETRRCRPESHSFLRCLLTLRGHFCPGLGS